MFVILKNVSNKGNTLGIQILFYWSEKVIESFQNLLNFARDTRKLVNINNLIAVKQVSSIQNRQKKETINLHSKAPSASKYILYIHYKTTVQKKIKRKRCVAV